MTLQPRYPTTYRKIVLAFSGGLDTSFCVPFLREQTGAAIITCTVDTGTLSPEERERLPRYARQLGAQDHVTIDAREDLFNRFIAYLIKGNVRRGGTYPLSVGVERVLQAEKTVAYALRIGADALAHGSTGAGNDQIRFDTALRTLAPDLDILTPIRDFNLTRSFTAAYLRERGIPVSEEKQAYSINRGLWGTTIGGKETLNEWDALPDEAFPDTVAPQDAPDEPLVLDIYFEEGIPRSVQEATGPAPSEPRPEPPVQLIERLNRLGAAHGVGRGMHVGDTILGIKGRIGYEAPAAEILLSAHRELEKIVLTKFQRQEKDKLADFYGQMLHEGHYYDPVMRDIEAFLDSSQKRVTGTVRVHLYKGQVFVQGCTSLYSLFNPEGAAYGEGSRLWTMEDARGFARLHGLQEQLAYQKMPEVLAENTNTST